jgi:exosortase
MSPASTTSLTPVRLRPLHLWISLFFLGSIGLFWVPLRQLVSLSLDDRRYSHLILIPLISGFFFYYRRQKIFAQATPAVRFGGSILAIALAIYAAVALAPLPEDYSLTVRMLAIVLVWAAGFALCYGFRAARSAAFPLLMLLLTVPLPFGMMDGIVTALQRGSAEVTFRFFTLLDVPVFRDGVRFELPMVGIEIAKECSSIHSGWALFITALIVAHLFLGAMWAKTLLAILSVPIAMLTNAVRIVTLWMLATKVDMGFLTGHLHHDGGILFSLISLSGLMAVLFLFRKVEQHRSA